MATAKKKAPPTNPLERLAQDPNALLLHLLWQRRIESPGLSLAISAKDRDGLAQCSEYLKAGLEVRAFVRGDRVLVQAVDKSSKIVVRRKVAGKSKEGADVVVDKDVDLSTGDLPDAGDVIVSIGDAIRPIENNEADFDAAAQADRVRAAKTNGVRLASQARAMAAGGTISTDMVVEVCDALLLLGTQP